MPISPSATRARYLALGDSYTIGESLSAGARWPNQLARMLRDAGADLADPDIIARTGWTTDELASALDALERGERVALTDAESAPKPAPPYQLLSLLIGVNDQYRGRALAQYRDALRPLIARAIDYAGGDATRVLALTIPDWGVTPFARGRDAQAIACEIDAFNAVKHAECARAGVACIDITAGTREAAVRPELLAADGLHPAAIEYQRWAEQALPAALAALAAGRR